MKKITLKHFKGVLCFGLLLTAITTNAQCLTSENGLYPADTYTPETCDGVTENVIATNAYAGEYTNVNLVSGQTYTFKSSVATDYMTISTDDGATAASFGATPHTWVSNFTGVARFYLHLNAACGEEDVSRTRSIVCGVATTDTPDFYNLQYPGTASVTAGTPLTVYGQVYEAGLTDPAGQADGIEAWVGVSTTNTNPNTWTDWTASTFNVQVDNNDEYMTNIGATSLPGTYYYATRFRLNNGPYVYGGIDSSDLDGGGAWDGTAFINGVLTVTAGGANDNFVNAETVACGSTYYGNTAVATTLDEDSAPDGGGADMDAPNRWYKYTGTGIEQTVTLSLCTSSYDTSVLVYTGTSGALTFVAANDDSCGPNGVQSLVNFTSDGTTTYYIAVEGYNVGSTGAYEMAVTCSSVTPPAVPNQTCALALAVPVDGLDTNSDNSFATVNPTQPTCDTFGAIQDVWFSFVAPASGAVNVSVTKGTMTSLNFNVYSGNCAALVNVPDACNSNLNDPEETIEELTGLTAGNTYYVQVWSNAVEQGTFVLRLSDGTLGTPVFANENFSYYPNPVKDILNLSHALNAISSVAVYNLVGQQVVAKPIQANEGQIDMSGLPKGVYMVKVTVDSQVKTIKVMKE